MCGFAINDMRQCNQRIDGFNHSYWLNVKDEGKKREMNFNLPRIDFQQPIQFIQMQLTQVKQIQ